MLEAAFISTLLPSPDLKPWLSSFKGRSKRAKANAASLMFDRARVKLELKKLLKELAVTK